MTVSLDKLSVKRIPVQVDWVGSPPAGMRLASAVLSPATIGIVGASRQLEAIDTIYTEPVDIGKLPSSGTFQTRLVLDPASVQIADGEVDRIEVRYVMGERTPL